MVVDIPAVVKCANVGDHWLRGFWVAVGQISPSPIDFHRRPYNTLAPPCERVISSFCFVTIGLFALHLLYYSFVLFLASAFLRRSTTFSFSHSHHSAHTSPHHTASQQYSHLNRTVFADALLAHAPFASAVSYFFCLFFCPATLNSTQVLQPSLCAL